MPARRIAHRPEYTVIDAPNFQSDPARHGTRSDVFILVHFGKKLVLIGGTHYAGEIKKSIFTILNYTLPLQGVLSMHCSANIGAAGDTALFFGLSGHRQDDAVERPAAPPDWRRRARLERHAASSTSRAAATPRSSSCRRRPSRRFTRRPGASAPFSRTWSSRPTRARSIWTARRTRRTRARPIRLTSSTTRRCRAAAVIRRTSSC